MDTRKVEVTEERLLDGASEYLAGDIKTLPKAKADQWIALGWAKCVETGEPFFLLNSPKSSKS
jgi:hypothetical protein